MGFEQPMSDLGVESGASEQGIKGQLPSDILAGSGAATLKLPQDSGVGV